MVGSGQGSGLEGAREPVSGVLSLVFRKTLVSCSGLLGSRMGLEEAGDRWVLVKAEKP